MGTPFTPGELTSAQARALNEMQRFAEQFSRLSVSPPLSLTRAAGIPCLRVEGAGGDVELILTEVVSHVIISTQPPIHTVKRKTKFVTTTDVVDLVPLVTYTQVLNPLEEVWQQGTLVAIFPIPEFEDWWWGIPIPTTPDLPSTIPCDPCGWTDDRAALVSQASSMDPPRVLAVRVVGGDNGGRCRCVDDQPALPDDPPLHAFYDNGTDRWQVVTLIATCCGCARLALDVPDAGGANGSGDWPFVTGTLSVITSCVDDLPVDVDLTYKCCAEDTAVLTGSGEDLCDGDIGDVCDQTFKVAVKCDVCSLPNIDCDECQELCAPPILSLPSTGFTGTYSVYDGPWYLPFISDSVTDPCKWEVTCGAITITAIMFRSGNDSILRVTYSGGPGSVVYEYTETNANLHCFADHTLAVTSGDTADTPDTITQKAIYCDTCPDFCATVWAQTIFLTVTNQTGACTCIPGSPTKVSQVTSPNYAATWGIDHPPCDNSTQIVLQCSGGRLNVVIGGGTGYTVTEVSRSADPFVYVVDVCFTSNLTNACPSGCFRLSFTT